MKKDKEIIKPIIEKSNKSNKNLKIKELEIEFNAFIKDIEAANRAVTETIQMDELNEIGEEIIKAKEYLSSFAKGEKKSIREKAYNQLISLPVIGKWADTKVKEIQAQNMRDSGVNEVIEGIFTSFNLKKKRLVELAELADNMRNNLIEQEKKLGEYIKKLDEIIKNPESAAEKMRALDMSIIAQSQDRIIKEMIYNQLNFIIELLENLMIKISKTLPVLKNTLNNSLSIVGTINSISDAVQMMNTLEELTNEITRVSTNNIQDLIVNVTQSLANGSDIEFYKDAAKRNEEFTKSLMQERIKYIEKTVQNYETLKQLEIDTTNQIQMRQKEEMKALGMTIEKLEKVEKDKKGKK